MPVETRFNPPGEVRVLAWFLEKRQENRRKDASLCETEKKGMLLWKNKETIVVRFNEILSALSSSMAFGNNISFSEKLKHRNELVSFSLDKKKT